MFTKAIVRLPATNFASGITTAELGPPVYTRAREQHEAYSLALTRCGLEVIRLDADQRYPDSTFVEDTAVIVADPDTSPKFVFTRPGAASRLGEVDGIRAAVAPLGFETFAIEPPGTLDGGDICEANNHFFVGLSERTNQSGAEQLTRLLASCGHASSFVDIRSVNGLLHLKSGLAYLGDNRLALINALAGHPAFADYETIYTTSEEAYATNCIRVNEHVLIAAGYPRLERSLTDLGYKTIALDMSEFEKMDGGLSCLSLRF